MAKQAAFIDANIIMYAVGTDHPLKKPCQEIVRKMAEGVLEGVTDTEVFQEILYRYWAQDKRTEGISTYNDLRGLISLVYPVTTEEMDLAADLLVRFPKLTPRDSIHIAVMQNHGIRELYSADRHFDGIPKVRRLGP